MTLLFDMSPADVADTSDDCYTPRWIFDASGLTFDLDVAAPANPAFRTCPAKRYLTPVEDGLCQPWEGLIWMNPPYSRCSPWVERFARHRCGLALLPAVKEVYWLGWLLECADAVTLIGADFARPDGSVKAPPLLILAGCGQAAAEAVGRVSAADKYVQGAYHVRPGMP
jgi:hypothetical protein